MDPQQIIVYRSPLEVALWEALTNHLGLCAVIFATLTGLCLVGIAIEKYLRKRRARSVKNFLFKE